MDPLAAQFDRYRRSGDLQALGALFDAVAPRLLRVALHLVGDPHEAEDLLQQTFLVAIERAASFDASQPFEPWLNGILRHHARNAGRRRRRSVGRDDADEPAVERAPSEDAERSELRKLLRRHIEELPGDQRQVLLLQLEHGLEPIEIARVLELSPGAVRMRLRRGRETLRRLLPAGVGFAVLATSGSSLATVRAQVLGAAGDAAARTAMVTIGGLVATGIGVLTMGKWIVSGVACLALVFGVLVFAAPGWSETTGEIARGAAVETSQGGEATVPPGASSSPEVSVSEGVAFGTTDRLPVVASSDPDPVVVTITGRAVDEAGLPLAGVEAELEGRFAAGIMEEVRHELTQGAVVWQRPEPVVTSDDGRFAFRFAPLDLYRIELLLSGAERVFARFDWTALEDGAHLELGDVVLPLGARLAGTLVDDRGEPVVDQPLRFESENPAPESLRRHTGVQTDREGAFESPWLILPGRYRVRVEGRELLAPREPLALTSLPRELRIVVASVARDPEAVLRGRVVDERGEPVADAEVFAWDAEPFQIVGLSKRATVRTDLDGRFELRRTADFAHESTTMVSAFREGFRLGRTDGPVAWDGPEILLRLGTGSPVEVQVTRVDTGEPVERFGVILAPQRIEQGRSSWDDRLQFVGDHPGGLLRIPNVSPARYRVDVVSALGPSAAGGMEFEVEPDSPTRIELQIAPVAEQVVEVVDASGAPLADVPVELVRHQSGGELSLEMPFMDTSHAGINGDRVGAIEATHRTDDAGRVTVRYAPSAGIGLRLPGPGHVPHLLQPLPIPGSEPLRLVVKRGATLRGRVGPPEVLEWMLSEQAREGEAARKGIAVQLHGLAESSGRSLPILGASPAGFEVSGEDGRFEVRDIPVGSWRVQACWMAVQRRPDGTLISSHARFLPLIERLEIEGSETCEVEVDLSRWLPVDVVVRTTVDGAPHGVTFNADTAIESAGPEAEQRFSAPFTTGDHGEAIVRLPPGLWHLEPRCELADGRVLFAWQTLLVPPRSSDEQPPQVAVFDFRIARATVRLVTPDGLPAVHADLRAGLADGGRALVKVTTPDAAGVAQIRGVAGTYQLYAIRRPFQDAAVRFAWFRDHPDASRDVQAVFLGDVEVALDAQLEQVIHLPEAWARLPD